ncbi:hypothetical protein JB92DRAFT_2824338 [Gautieria morchelliformis]|nr:hypothetical protein JB92DRAFT_2824338 [Gautieria morchelliformis]
MTRDAHAPAAFQRHSRGILISCVQPARNVPPDADFTLHNHNRYRLVQVRTIPRFTRLHCPSARLAASSTEAPSIYRPALDSRHALPVAGSSLCNGVQATGAGKGNGSFSIRGALEGGTPWLLVQLRTTLPGAGLAHHSVLISIGSKITHYSMGEEHHLPLPRLLASGDAAPHFRQLDNRVPFIGILPSRS